MPPARNHTPSLPAARRTAPRRASRLRTPRPRLGSQRRRSVVDAQRRLDRNLDLAVANLEAQLTRCDGKASLLLAFVGAVLVFADRPRPSATAAVFLANGAGTVALAAAVVLLLLAVWAHTKSWDDASWPFWARISPREVVTRLAKDRRPDQVCALSRLLERKYARINAGIALTAIGLPLLLAADRISYLP